MKYIFFKSSPSRYTRIYIQRAAFGIIMLLAVYFQMYYYNEYSATKRHYRALVTARMPDGDVINEEKIQALRREKEELSGRYTRLLRKQQHNKLPIEFLQDLSEHAPGELTLKKLVLTGHQFELEGTIAPEAVVAFFAFLSTLNIQACTLAQCNFTLRGTYGIQ